MNVTEVVGLAWLRGRVRVRVRPLMSLVVGAAVLSALTGGALALAGGATGTGNPGGYMYPGGYDNSVPGSSDMSWYFKVHSVRISKDDPIYTANYVWFQNGAGGYVGFAHHTDGTQRINLSLWDTTANSGTAQPWGNCWRFSGEGTGTACSIKSTKLSTNTWYEIRLRKTGRIDSSTRHGDIWTGHLINVATRAVTLIGSILLLDNKGYQGYGNMTRDSLGFVEYFGWGPGGGNPCSSRSAYDFEFYGPVFNNGTNVPATVSPDNPGCSSLTYTSAGRGYYRVAFNPGVNTPVNVPTGVNFMSTLPATAPATFAAYQAATGHFWTMQPAATNRTVSVMPGTSPSIATQLGDYRAAFQADTGYLWLANAERTANTGLVMMNGTSPSTAAVPGGGYQTAFQAKSGRLWVAGALGTGDTGLGMMTGTSPSITAVPGGAEIAFQANTGHLWTTGALGRRDWGFAMMPGTSPAIASCNGSYSVAFQAKSGHLWTLGAIGTGDTGLAMMPGTSPAIACHSGAYAVAFQADTGTLWTTGNALGATTDTGLTMMTGTSPSIAYGINGFTTAAQANTGHLWFLGATGTTDTGLAMTTGTSPAIA